MLDFDPAKRITVEGILAHPYLGSYHDPEEEVCTLLRLAHVFAADVAVTPSHLP